MTVSRYEGSFCLDFFTNPFQLVEQAELFDVDGFSSYKWIVKLVTAAVAIIVSASHYGYPTIFCYAVKWFPMDNIITFFSMPTELVEREAYLGSLKKTAATAALLIIAGSLVYAFYLSLPSFLVALHYGAIDSLLLCNLIYYSASVSPLGSFYSARFKGLFNTAKSGSGAVVNFCVNRRMLKNFPLRVVEEYMERLRPLLMEKDLEEIGTRISFEGELGEDVTGLSKDFYMNLFAEIVAIKGILDFTEEDLSSYGCSYSLEEFYKALGILMIHAGVRKELVVGSCIEEDFFKAVHGALSGDFIPFRKGEATAEQREKLKLDAASSLISFFDESMRESLAKQVKFLRGEEEISREIAEALVNTNAFLDQDAITEDEVLQNPAAYVELAKSCLSANIDLLIGKELACFFAILKGMDQGVKGFEKYESHIRNMAPIDFIAHICGILDKEAIVKSLEVVPHPTKDNEEFLRKVELLKKWLTEVATKDELKLFLSFFTGTTALIPRKPIQLSPNYNPGQYATASACFNKATLSGLNDSLEGDETVEQFGRALLATMGSEGQGFTIV